MSEILIVQIVSGTRVGPTLVQPGELSLGLTRVMVQAGLLVAVAIREGNEEPFSSFASLTEGDDCNGIAIA